MKGLVKKILRSFGCDLVRYPYRNEAGTGLGDFSERERGIIAAARPFTMTSMERMAALLNAVTYVATQRIPGDIVECGVWRGGSMMVAALTLMEHGDTSRDLYLYDTYEGMTTPGDMDKNFDGVLAEKEYRDNNKVWLRATVEDVQANLFSTGYPREKIHFIKGKVEETIPGTIPRAISLLRLDTDWYDSTKHELTHLVPLMDPDGVLIIDDYGHWQGSRKAVDEYFMGQKRAVYLHRIDYSGRMIVGFR